MATVWFVAAARRGRFSPSRRSSSSSVCPAGISTLSRLLRRALSTRTMQPPAAGSPRMSNARPARTRVTLFSSHCSSANVRPRPVCWMSDARPAGFCGWRPPRATTAMESSPERTPNAHRRRSARIGYFGNSTLRPRDRAAASSRFSRSWNICPIPAWLSALPPNSSRPAATCWPACPARGSRV